MEGVFRLNVQMRRTSDLQGVFIAKKDKVKYLIDNGIQVYFGEVAGKHSEVYGSLSEKEITLITDDQGIVDIVRRFDLESGLNPFDYSPIDFDERDRFPDCSIGEIIDHKLNGTYPTIEED